MVASIVYALLVASLYFSHLIGASHIVALNVTTLSSIRLPKPLSDGTAVLQTKVIYLHGGCDSPNGNQFQGGNFSCNSISNASYAFSLNNLSFVMLPDMPTPRYRHAAVALQNQVLLVGGRSVTDQLIATVDVYDISSKLWTTYDLAEPYVVSDHTGFAFGDQAFFCGGYNQTYAAVGTCFSLRIPNATHLEITDLPPLPTPRADMASVTYGDYALVSGGVSDGCAPRNTTERLNLSERTWTERSDSLVARAGQVLVKTDDAETDPHLYAIGGERPMNPLCTRSTDDLPRSETTLLNAVVSYDVSTDTWSRIQDLSKSRWRFVAVGYDDTIYSFGGQRSFNDTCQCFPTSDEVTLYTEIAGAPTFNVTSNLTSAASPSIPWTAGVVTTVLTWMMMTVIIK